MKRFVRSLFAFATAAALLGGCADAGEAPPTEGPGEAAATGEEPVGEVEAALSGSCSQENENEQRSFQTFVEGCGTCSVVVDNEWLQKGFKTNYAHYICRNGRWQPYGNSYWCQAC